MSDLVNVVEIKTFLGFESPQAKSDEDSVLNAILDSVEAAFEADAGRSSAPFSDAITARSEIKDGTGVGRLTLDYPIASVASIALGQDSANLDETLDPDDIDDVTFGVGEIRIYRTDGGVFGPLGCPRYVKVVYTTQSILPGGGNEFARNAETAVLAIKRITAAIYNQKGSEGSKTERQGGWAAELLPLTTGDPLWAMAVNQNSWRAY